MKFLVMYLENVNCFFVLSIDILKIYRKYILDFLKKLLIGVSNRLFYFTYVELNIRMGTN